MTDRGPRTKDLDEELKDLVQEVNDLDRRMADGMSDLRTELVELKVGVKADISYLRTDLAEFRGGVKADLRWIKGIGAALLLSAFAFAGWAIRDVTSLQDKSKGQEDRLDRIEKKLDTLIERTNPKGP